MHTLAGRAGCTEATPWQKVEMTPVGEGQLGMPKSVLGGVVSTENLCRHHRKVSMHRKRGLLAPLW